ncbi:MAG: hypothetical protein HYZ72_19020 [Deltaproteobacteria bacterium]|nr:hypothetical protein [Deltaproteobacteria bacterium]
MMTTIRTKSILFVLLTFCVVGAGPAVAQPLPRRGEEQFVPRQPLPRPNLPEVGPEEEGGPRFRGRLRGEGFEQRREERRRRLERARNMAYRLLDNPNTPEDIKAKARRLTELLNKREDLERKIDGKRQDFLRAHRQELDELRQLQERGEILRQNLRSAREKAIAEDLPTIQEMRRVTEEARDTAQEIRRQYQGRRGRDRDEPPENRPQTPD